MSLALERMELGGGVPAVDAGDGRSPARGRPEPERPPAPTTPADEPLGDEAALVLSVLAELNAAAPAGAASAERRAALVSVCRLAKLGSAALWSEHFRLVRHTRFLNPMVSGFWRSVTGKNMFFVGSVSYNLLGISLSSFCSSRN